MLFYILTIVISMAVIIAANIIFNTFSLPIWYIVVAVIVETVAVIAITGFVAFVIRHLLPKRWFDHTRQCYNVGKRELKFYQAIGVKKWKDKIPELGGFSGFNKNMDSDNIDSSYIERFIYEVNCGYVCHLVGMFAGFLIVFIYPLQYWYMFALPVAIVDMFLHFLPVCVLRYNQPRLVLMHKVLLRKERNAIPIDNN